MSWSVEKEKIVQAVKDIKVGNPLNEETRMGALSSAEHREKVSGYIQGELVIINDSFLAKYIIIIMKGWHWSSP